MQQWEEKRFVTVSLQSLGQRVQLGHRLNLLCSFPVRGHKNFVLIDINGIHPVNVDFCGCDNAAPHRHQLLDVGWWPSTPLNPQSVATFSVLRTFHLLNLQGQIALTDFYWSLEQLVCGDGLSSIPVSFLSSAVSESLILRLS